MCAGCGRKTSVTAGTIFEGRRTSLQTCFTAAWWVISQKQGMSAMGLQRALGLGSYQTARMMLHRFRVAMVRPGRDRLSGYVEVDETYVGGDQSGVRGREDRPEGHRRDRRRGRRVQGLRGARLPRVLDVSKDSLIPFVTSAVEPGATVHTDGWQAYWTVPDHGYTHERTVMRQQSEPAHVVMPGVHRVASLLKRWLLGTHQGSVSPQHLDAYLNEFTFRFNRRTSRRRGLVFHRLIEQAANSPPAPYKTVINPTRSRLTKDS